MLPTDRLMQITDRFEFLEAQLNTVLSGDEIARVSREYAVGAVIRQSFLGKRQAQPKENFDVREMILDCRNCDGMQSIAKCTLGFAVRIEKREQETLYEFFDFFVVCRSGLNDFRSEAICSRMRMVH